MTKAGVGVSKIVLVRPFIWISNVRFSLRCTCYAFSTVVIGTVYSINIHYFFKMVTKKLRVGTFHRVTLSDVCERENVVLRDEQSLRTNEQRTIPALSQANCRCEPQNDIFTATSSILYGLRMRNAANVIREYWYRDQGAHWWKLETDLSRHRLVSKDRLMWTLNLNIYTRLSYHKTPESRIIAKYVRLSVQ
jgi:hypothetical protein